MSVIKLRKLKDFDQTIVLGVSSGFVVLGGDAKIVDLERPKVNEKEAWNGANGPRKLKLFKDQVVCPVIDIICTGLA